MTTIDSTGATPARSPKRKWRGWWLRQLHTWHWMSAAVSLVGMLLFAITGITLNHAASIAAKPVVSQQAGTLPASLLREIARPAATDSPLPPQVAAAVAGAVGLDPAGKPGEWSDTDVYVALPRPGGDGWISIDRANGRITSEKTSRGWIAYLNDLHKGRNAGGAWGWFLDVFAGACILFTLTGFLLLHLHSRHRPSTWPIVAGGVAIPTLILLFHLT